jgi:hypothetical protein
MSSITKLEEFYKRHFPSAIDTLHECSLDSKNNCYLVNELNDCINYDKVKDNFFCGGSKSCSSDSLYFDKSRNRIVFIEFKNMKLKECKSNFIYSAKDSYMINRCLATFCPDIDLDNIKIDIILVLPESKNSSILTSFKKSELSNRLDENQTYKSMKDKLIGINLYDNNLYFNRLVICSETNICNYL